MYRKKNLPPTLQATEKQLGLAFTGFFNGQKQVFVPSYLAEDRCLHNASYSTHAFRAARGPNSFVARCSVQMSLAHSTCRAYSL